MAVERYDITELIKLYIIMAFKNYNTHILIKLNRNSATRMLIYYCLNVLESNIPPAPPASPLTRPVDKISASQPCFWALILTWC